MTGRYLRLEPNQVEELLADPGLAEKIAFPEVDLPPELGLDIDKSWDMLHFLLTRAAEGSVSPLSQAVLGGLELEGTGTGYGPFRLFEPAEVSAIAQALNALPGEELWMQFDAQKALEAEVYPEGWSGANHERAYVLGHYAALQAFAQLASSRRQGLLAYLA